MLTFVFFHSVFEGPYLLPSGTPLFRHALALLNHYGETHSCACLLRSVQSFYNALVSTETFKHFDRKDEKHGKSSSKRCPEASVWYLYITHPKNKKSVMLRELRLLNKIPWRTGSSINYFVVWLVDCGCSLGIPYPNMVQVIGYRKYILGM